jgi:hypothetical protein
VAAASAAVIRVRVWASDILVHLNHIGGGIEHINLTPPGTRELYSHDELLCYENAGSEVLGIGALPMAKTQIWLAAGLALIFCWIVTVFANFLVQLLAAQIISALGRNSALASGIVSVISAVSLALVLEVSKFVAVIWPLKRRWDQWAPLGTAFGILVGIPYAAGLYFRLLFSGLTPNADTAVYAGFIYLATKIALLHWALGRLAASIALRPGGPGLALVTVSLVSSLISLLPLQPAIFFIDLPTAVLTEPQWLLDIPFILFLLAVWKWLPAPTAHQAYGPARWIMIILALFLLFLGWSLFVCAAFFGPARIDAFSLPLMTLAAGFLTLMLYRFVLHP